MSRVADYTIQGFLYQFNKTLLEILNSPDDSYITVEGIVEDVEITTLSGITAIQCKYHEASKTFSSSDIFEPLLQMMYHFNANPTTSIRYILFAHYPSTIGTSRPTIGKIELQDALDSENKDFRKYVTTLRGNVNLDCFIENFVMEFGPSLDDLVKQACKALKENGIPEGDIDTLAYPNAIQMIAEVSTKHDQEKRRITKRKFIDDLKRIRQTAISRWTMALRTRKQLLDARRKQLKIQLDKNSRLRYFVINSENLCDYDTEIVLFINDYLEKFHFKPTHISTPLFCLCTSKEKFQDIRYRLYTKGIISNDGYIGEYFDETRFFRDPLLLKGAGRAIKREFSLRLVRWQDHGTVLNSRKCDDLFIIGECDCDSLDTVDVNTEIILSKSLMEIKYVLGVSNVYE